MHHNHVLPDNVEKPPYSTSPVPSKLGDLKFNPLDVYNLRRFIGALPENPGAYTMFRDRFDAADIAYFAAGCSTDGKHDVGTNRFHSMIKDMYSCKYGSFNYESRKKLRDRVQALTFDMVCSFLLSVQRLLISVQATLWDRAFGGSTIVIHVEGSHQPNVPNVPENTRAAVYLPPSTVVKELPDAHETIAFIVQAFIEEVGIPTVDRWTAAAKNHLNFSLTMSGSRAPIKSYMSFIPPPVKVGHAHYIFQGLPRHTVTLNKPNHFETQDRADYSPDADGCHDLSTYANANGEAYSQEYRTHFEELETNYVDQISSLQAEVFQYQEHIISLEAEIIRLKDCIKDREPVPSPGSSLRTPLKETKTLRSMVSFIFRWK